MYVTGVIRIENEEIAVLDSDLGSIETQQKYVIVFSKLSSFFLLSAMNGGNCFQNLILFKLT